MIPSTRLSVKNAGVVVASAVLITLGCANLIPTLRAQSSPGPGASGQVAASGSSHDRWLHVRVTNPNSSEESVRVNVPLELAEKILPTINQHRLHSGKVSFDEADCHGVDIRALLDAVRTSKDGEFVDITGDLIFFGSGSHTSQFELIGVRI